MVGKEGRREGGKEGRREGGKEGSIQTEESFKRTRRYRRLAWATIIAVLLMLSLPGQWINDLKVWFQILLKLPSAGLIPWEFPADKLIHAALFALCGALFLRGWTTFQDRWWLVCVMLFLYGVFTELIQRFVPGRSATLSDLLADGIGVIIGVGFTLFYLRKRTTIGI